MIADRGYDKRKEVACVACSGAYFVIRTGWSHLPLEDMNSEPFDLLGALQTVPDARASEFHVQTRIEKNVVIPCRLVATRKSEAAAERARQQILAEARRHGNPRVDLRTLEAAGYVMVVTNLPFAVSPESVLEQYRFRWQIELKFKTLKSVIHLRNPPTKSSDFLNVYLTAKLIVALLIEDFVHQAESLSPWGYPLRTDPVVAADTPSS